ncbi:MAG: c-type cytochrome [Gemmatimonadales bacterium]
MRYSAAGMALVAFGLLFTAPAAQAQEELPDGVTDEMIANGKTVFGGAGICMVCHGPQGAGIANLGADLTDDEWLHSDGTYEGILATIEAGVAADKSSTGGVMPPKGSSSISDEQVKAVAAYVWSLSS